MADALVGRLENAVDLGFEHLSKLAEEASHSGVAGPVLSPAAGCTHLADGTEVLFHRSYQLPFGSGHDP